MKNKFLEEIEEQPQALQNTILYYKDGKGSNILSHVSELWHSGKYDKMILTGMGSSYFISQSTASMLAAQGVPAFAFSASELLHYQYPIVQSSTLLICISQSGESYEVVQLIHQLPANITIVAICNEEESSLVVRANYTLLSVAGKEQMTSTKTFTSSMLVAYLLVHTIIGDQVETLISSLPDAASRILEESDVVMEKVRPFFDDCQSLLFIGRGTDIAVALQSALMFMEATNTVASAMLGGEFRHGPLEMVGKNFCSVLFSNAHSETYPAMVRLVDNILKFDGKVLFVTDNKTGIRHDNLFEIEIKGQDPDMWSILSVIPIQMLVIDWAKIKGMTPGEFSHGGKVTVIE
jgi:glucosamine--fructose-6-phosphate aminotransferase (isomerizing)